MGNTLETLALMGAGVKAGAQIGGGIAAKRAGEFEARQYESNASNARAAGQRAGFEEAAKTSKVLGTQLARAADDGGGVSNPTVLDIMGETAQRGKYLEEAERYKGDMAANADLNRATAARTRGKNAMVGSILEGVGTLGTGIGKYGPGLRTAGAAPTDDDTVTDVDTKQTIRNRRYG